MSNDVDIAARLMALEDRTAIQTLCSRYSLAVDDHEYATLKTLFAPDAECGMDTHLPFRGPEAILASCAKILAAAEQASTSTTTTSSN